MLSFVGLLNRRRWLMFPTTGNMGTCDIVISMRKALTCSCDAAMFMRCFAALRTWRLSKQACSRHQHRCHACALKWQANTDCLTQTVAWSLTVIRYKLRLPTLTEMVQLSCLVCPGSSFFSAKQTSQGSSFMLNVLSVSPSEPLLRVT